MKTNYIFTKFLSLLLLTLSFITGTAQIITSVAGNGTAGYSGNGGQATSAELQNPSGVVFDAAGNMYIADETNGVIRKVNTSDVISTVAGRDYDAYSGDGGAATSAELDMPYSVIVDAMGDMYIGDVDNARVREVNTSGIINTIAGNGYGSPSSGGYSGDGGPATSAELYSPKGVAEDASGNIYIADFNNNRIRMVNTSGVISTYAGNGTGAFSGDGGAASSAELYHPDDVAFDATGNMYIADEYNHRIRKINTSGIISTIAGSNHNGFYGDGGAATSAELDYPTGVTLDGSGNIYIADYFNDRIRKVNTSGIISTVAGNGYGSPTSGGYSGDGGQAAAAELYHPYRVSFDASGNLYVADYKNNRIREVYLVLNITPSVTSNVSCNGGTNGSASVTASNGTTPYTYSWVPGGGTNASNTTLSAGTYTIYVTDNDGIKGSATAVISQPAKPLWVIANTTAEVTCNGGSNGSVSATANNGTSPYTYSWSGGGTNSTKTGLTAGTYTITLTDNNGCTATAFAIVTQPAVVAASIVWTKNASCYGAIDGSALATATGGTIPYTYSWAPGGKTTAEITGLGAGTYSLYVIDINGCTGSTSANITQPPVLTVTTNNFASIVYAATTGGTPPYTYSWTPGGSTTAIVTGASAGTYTVTVEDANGCMDSVVVNLTISVTIPTDSIIRFPRWSKRGVQVEFADAYYYPSDSLNIKGGALADYCRKNHITYVLLDGVYYGGNTPYGAFDVDFATVNPTYGAALQSLIYMLKTRGHVEQIGVDVYNSDPGFHDTGSYAVKNFDVNNFVNAVHTYNIGLPWQYKIDILSLDEEFWGTYINSDPPKAQWDSTINDFDRNHLPMLRSMYKAVHECDANFLRVEDYIAPPFNPDTSATNVTQSNEMDSICKYADRILFSSYTSYPSVLWDRNDWVPGYQEIGRNPARYYYKKEIWGMFDAANLNNHTCDTCDDGSSNPFDFLGDSTCHLNTTSVNMEQQWYYKYFGYSMEHRLWTPNNTSKVAIGADTCFELMGSMWYQFRCLQKLCHFDTLTYEPTSKDTVLPIWVTLGHDTQWHSSPIVLRAKVHGGTAPYVYIWYNDANGLPLNGGARLSTLNYDTLTVRSPKRVSVLVIDLQDSTAIDYVNVYNDTCYYPLAVQSIPLPDYVVDLYPNPANTEISIEMAGNIGKQNAIDIYDMLGQKVQSEELMGKRTTISVSALRQGVYFYRITGTW